MINVEHLTKRYGPVVAVDDLSLEVPGGEVFCFLGPNGAGKTTTIKVLTGLVRPTSGRARIGGIDVAADPVAAKRLLGYIPDMPFLYDRLTPVEFMQFVGELYGMGMAAISTGTDRLFDVFDLDGQRSALIRELSHGMRQRLIYCATLLHDPKVLLIDEPLIGLDPHTIRLIKNLLREKAASGMAIMLTTHILALAQDVADRIGIIHCGRMIELGTMSELRARHGGSTLEDVFLHLTEKTEAGGK
ncbi:MAG: ABC transporter ATP-binding protein [Lentisphaerae bacterium]|nr:ABC transporter ATP-binding protein [Lentisphaerota bacterium]